MATPGACIAEAYVLKKMHKAKMKRIDEEKSKIEEIDLEEKGSTGCFSWKNKKIHPKRISSANNTGKETERWENKG